MAVEAIAFVSDVSFWVHQSIVPLLLVQSLENLQLDFVELGVLVGLVLHTMLGVCVWSVGAGASQGGSSDQVLAHHGSSSSLASSSACSVQSSSTEKNVDNLSMRDGRCEDGRSV